MAVDFHREATDRDRTWLLEVIRQHAYAEIALEEMLTIQPTEHGALVPGHWVEATDARIASLLPTSVLLAALGERASDGA